jgi:hypothetical protein
LVLEFSNAAVCQKGPDKQGASIGFRLTKLANRKAMSYPEWMRIYDGLREDVSQLAM